MPAYLTPLTRSSCSSNSSDSDLWFSSCRCVANVGICEGRREGPPISLHQTCLQLAPGQALVLLLPPKDDSHHQQHAPAAAPLRSLRSPAQAGPAHAAWCLAVRPAAPPPAPPPHCCRPGRRAEGEDSVQMWQSVSTTGGSGSAVRPHSKAALLCCNTCLLHTHLTTEKLAHTQQTHACTRAHPHRPTHQLEQHWCRGHVPGLEAHTLHRSIDKVACRNQG